jgi:uncharacterized iron-regulated protein
MHPKNTPMAKLTKHPFLSKPFLYLFTLLVLIFGTPSFSQTMDHYRIFSTLTNKEVTLEDIAANMQGYDVLFYGEEHNDSIAHNLQLQLLTLLFNKYQSNVALSLEMFDRDVQPIMNEYLKDEIKERHFLKDSRPWNNYNDYKPLVEFAKAHQLDVICANAPTRYTNLAGRKGQVALKELPKETRKNFAPLPYAVATGKYYEKLMEVMGHAMPADTTLKAAPAKPLPEFDFVASQSLWDATMAYSIASYLKKYKHKKIMQVNGRFHSDERFAIVTQLKTYCPKAKTLIISSGTDDAFPNIDWSKHKHLGDYIIITDPKVARSF